jgi:hypothetical protein
MVYSQIVGGKRCPPQVELSLPDCIWYFLQLQKIQGESINAYIASLGPLTRYGSAFKKTVLHCQVAGTEQMDLAHVSPSQVDEAILTLAQHSLNDARNSYSACLLIPGFGGLRFHPLLSKIKKDWGGSIQKYASFWNPEKILERFLLEPPDLGKISLTNLRSRLILCWRILSLHRGVDLSRTERTISKVEENFLS